VLIASSNACAADEKWDNGDGTPFVDVGFDTEHLPLHIKVMADHGTSTHNIRYIQPTILHALKITILV
jgi:hypothetical protein